MTAAADDDRVILDARAAFRLPAAVLSDWKSRATAAGYRNLSDFLRAAVDAQRVTKIATPRQRPRPEPKLVAPNGADPALMMQVAALGNNLNQIARALNQCKKNGSTVQVVECLALLRKIEAAALDLLPTLPPPPSQTRSAEATARARARAGATSETYS